MDDGHDKVISEQWNLGGLKGGSRRPSCLTIILMLLLAISFSLVITLAVLLATGVLYTTPSPSPLTGVVAPNTTMAPITTPGPTTTPSPPLCDDIACLGNAAKLAVLRNGSIDPCEDFYSYACSGFPKVNRVLKPEEYDFTVYHRLVEENEEKLRTILESPLYRDLNWAAEKKIKQFYTSCTDEFGNTVNGGSDFLNKVVRPAGGWNLLNDPMVDQSLTTWLVKVHSTFWTDALFSARVGSDWTDSTQNVLQIGLGGTTLPWYYYNQGAQLDALRTFMKTTGQLLLRDSKQNMLPAEIETKSTQFAADALLVESKVGNLTWHTLPSSNPHDRENRVTVADMNRLAPAVAWTTLLPAMFQSLSNYSNVVVLERDLLSKLDTVINTLAPDAPTRNRILNNYFVWRLSLAYVQDVGWEYVHANRVFYVALTGYTEFLGNYRYCFSKIDRHFPDALGYLYVRELFNKEDIPVVHDVVSYLKKGLADRVRAADWMDNSTKTIAIDKEQSTKEKLGYPSWFNENDKVDAIYQHLTLTDGDYLGNLIALAKFERYTHNDRLTSGRDPNDWLLKVYDIQPRRMYSTSLNELLVPAGLLQWPVYNPHSKFYINFGGMGAAIAKQLVHSVDEIGGYYYKNGTVFDWWTAQTTTDYNAKRTCWEKNEVIAGPFHPYTPASPPLMVKIAGTFVARELISEIGGIRTALYGYRDWVADKGEEAGSPGLDLTNEQIFFLSYAQNKCYIRKDWYAYSLASRHQVPEDKLVNLALSHVPEFAQAFSCNASSKLVVPKEKLCEVF